MTSNGCVGTPAKKTSATDLTKDLLMDVPFLFGRYFVLANRLARGSNCLILVEWAVSLLDLCNRKLTHDGTGPSLTRIKDAEQDVRRGDLRRAQRIGRGQENGNLRDWSALLYKSVRLYELLSEDICYFLLLWMGLVCHRECWPVKRQR